LLVNRAQDRVELGHRVLARDSAPPVWMITGAAATSRVQPEANPLLASVATSARLQLTGDGGRWLGLEVPDAAFGRVAGSLHMDDAWTVAGVSRDGVALPVTIAPGRDLEIDIARPDRRLVIVDLGPDPGTALTLDVAWSQRVPWKRADHLATTNVQRGTGTPMLPALPTVAGAARDFPYQLVVHAPAAVDLVVSGTWQSDELTRKGRTVRTRGTTGGAATVVAGQWSAQAHGPVSVHFERSGDAQSAARLVGAFAAWSGLPASDVDLVELPPEFTPPRALWGEGIAGIRPVLTLADSLWFDDAVDAPNLDAFLLSEGVAGASLAHLAVDAVGAAWVDALARAFALDLQAALDPKAARTWRRDLQTCATLPTRTPALSPEVAATSGFRDPSVRCAAPLVLGPMLADRFGEAGALRIRSALLASGRADVESWRVAALAEDPEAGPWVDRWLRDGHIAGPIAASIDTVEADEGGWRVRGTVRSGTELGGAPVVVRLMGAKVDLAVPVPGREAAFDVVVPGKPSRAVVDPELRLLRPGPLASTASERSTEPG
jgi:hypothetical protein